MRGLIPLVAAAATLAAPSAAAASSIVRVTIGRPARDVPQLRALGLDVTEAVRHGSADVVITSRAELRRLRAAGYAYRTVVPSVEAANARARAIDRSRARAASGLSSGRTEYRHYDDYVRELGALVAAHPGLVRPVTLPERTVLGEPIIGVEIAKDVNRSDDGRPVYVVMGEHHAREWPSGEVAMEFVLDLARGYGTDARITSLLDRERVDVLPVINVDGFKISREDVAADAAYADTANAGALKRKNCEADTPGEGPLPCQDRSGVDLNRNYGAFWGGDGASLDYVDDDYRGAGPWSEPETQAVHEFSQHLQITGLETLHNYAGLVLRPPGFAALGTAPDEARLKELGDAMGRVTGYTSEHGYELYDVTGATEDWNYTAQGTFGYTIELGGSDFQDPYQRGVVDQYLGTPGTATAGLGVREALLLAGEQAADPADHAIVAGSAPPGRVLRLHKDFTTPTSPVCPIGLGPEATCPEALAPLRLDDMLDTTMVVPADGRFTWHVGPSTRPWEHRAGRQEAWMLTCETPEGQVLETQAVTVWRGETAMVDLACDGSAPASAPKVSETPPDPASVAFEERLSELTAGAPAGARLTAGDVLTTREETVRRDGVLRVAVRVRGTTLHAVSALLRARDGRVLARGQMAQLRGRGRIVMALPHGLRAGRYRVALRGFAPNGAPMAASLRVVVRR